MLAPPLLAAVALAVGSGAETPAASYLVSVDGRVRWARQERASRVRVNPTGLDATGQSSCAADLLVLTQAALARPEFVARVGLARASVATVAGRRFELTSSNALLGKVRGAAGVKTGSTARAGECLVALAEREGHRVIVIPLGAEDRWGAAAALIEAGFDATP
ncbi:MAG TPA: hypothetical protein VJS92_13910 [Candidatus Polarisedimenticolaceae bacterium]|nr:hypothetical protein [Candidatus Polarisedimenticolaceae bacterium]